MADFREKVEEVLEDHVRPILALHKGDVGIVNADVDTGVVELKFLGTCQGCPITSITFVHVIEKALMEEMPEVNEVIDVDNPSYE